MMNEHAISSPSLTVHSVSWPSLLGTSQARYVGVLAREIEPKFKGDIRFEVAAAFAGNKRDSQCLATWFLALCCFLLTPWVLLFLYTDPPRIVHPVPYLTICATPRHVNRSRPQTAKVGPKVTCLWNTITFLWIP